MKNTLSRALLGAAVLSSIATSSSEPAPAPAPVGPRSSATLSDTLVLAPGQSAMRTVRVGVPFADMPEITDSWVEAGATVQTQAGSATIEVELVGFDQTNVIELFADPTPYEDLTSVTGIDTGCLSGGDGLCWSEWTVHYTHIGGTSDVYVDWTIEAVVPEEGFDLAIEAL